MNNTIYRTFKKWNKSTLLFGVAGLALTQACTKDFEAINTNPNQPVEAPMTNVLAYVLQDFSANFYDAWGNMNEPSTYSGHLGKIAYIDEARYMFRSGTISDLWNKFYRDVKNAQLVIDRAEVEGATNMRAVALTFQAYMWQLGTDRWRDMPFTEAIRGDEGFVTPKYDRQEDIYPAIITQLEQAADLFAEGSNDQLGDGDLLFGGDVEKWRKFCNSLRLRVALRLSAVDAAGSQSTVQRIFSDPQKYPLMESNSDNAYFYWVGSDPYVEPWNNDSRTRDDHGVSVNIVDTLKKYTDPRLAVYAKPAPSDGEYRGVTIGPASSPTVSLYSRIGARFRDDAAGFSPFMNYAELNFVVAELAQKGWSTGSTTAQIAYEQGITASFQENGLSAAQSSAYLSESIVAWSNRPAQIHLQKWLALFKNGHEAWAEMRRTDFPLLPAAAGSAFPGHNRPPLRYPYPAEETTLNGQNSAASRADVDDNFWGKQMWWDQRTGVN